MTQPDRLPQSPYGASGYGDDPGTSPGGAPARKNVLGLVALIVGASISLVELLTQIVTTATIAARGPIQIASAVGLLTIGLLAIVAVGLGVAGLLQKRAPRAAAAAGTALGAAALFGVLTAMLNPLILSAFYR